VPLCPYPILLALLDCSLIRIGTLPVLFTHNVSKPTFLRSEHRGLRFKIYWQAKRQVRPRHGLVHAALWRSHALGQSRVAAPEQVLRRRRGLPQLLVRLRVRRAAAGSNWKIPN